MLVAKDGHPNAYVKWLKSLKMSVATAYRYMAVAQKFDETAIKSMTLWEAYEAIDGAKSGKGRGKKAGKGKSPAYYTNHVTSVAKLVETRAWEKWTEKERATFLASLSKLMAMVEKVGIVPAAKQPAPAVIPPSSSPFINPAVVHAAVMSSAPVEGAGVLAGVR